MPRIFDNIGRELLPALQETLDVSERSAEETDFIINHDIKFRMGVGGEGADDEDRSCRP